MNISCLLLVVLFALASTPFPMLDFSLLIFEMHNVLHQVNLMAANPLHILTFGIANQVFNNLSRFLNGIYY